MSRPRLDVHALLRRHQLRPDKRLGQNFLVDEAALQRVVEAAGLSGSETVLEVGPGLGSLTLRLATAARRVVAVELDSRLFPALEEVLAGCGNVELVCGDILEVNLVDLVQDAASSAYKVVANIPYYLTSALIRRLLESRLSFERLVLTVQREVAERIVAVPDDMNLLALSVQVYGNPQVVAHIPAGAFFPVPEVDSAVVRIDLYPEPLLAPQPLEQFFRLARAGFSQKRKTLRNSLSGGMQCTPGLAASLLEKAGIDANRRAETLSLADWFALAASWERGAAA